MALNVKHVHADELARKLAEVTGQSITDAVIKALREQLQRETGKRSGSRLENELRTICRRCSQLPDRDTRRRWVYRCDRRGSCKADVSGNRCLLYTSPSPRDRQKSR